MPSIVVPRYQHLCFSLFSQINKWLKVKIFLHSQTASSAPRDALETKIRADAYGAQPYLYDSPVDGLPPKGLSLMHENGLLSREHVVEGESSRIELYSQPGRQMQMSLSPRNSDLFTQNDANVYVERKRKVVLLCLNFV